jgi:hypothetical protein
MWRAKNPEIGRLLWWKGNSLGIVRIARVDLMPGEVAVDIDH